MVLKWKRATVASEMLKSATALFLVAWVSLMLPLLSYWQLLLGPLAGMFSIFLWNCLVKMTSTVTIDEFGVSVTRRWLPPKRMLWSELETLEVRSFSLGQFRKKSLMDVKLASGNQSIVIDDGVEQFRDALQSIWRSAVANGVSVSGTTRANLLAAGCSTDADGLLK